LLETQRQYAALRTAQGDVEHAVELYRATIRGLEASEGTAHIHTINVMTELAELFHGQQRIAEARELFQKAFELLEAKHTIENVETLGAAFRLASFLDDCGLWKEVKAICKRVINDETKALAKGASYVAHLEKIFERLLTVESARMEVEAATEKFGDLNEVTLTAKSNLAGVLKTLGKTVEAEELYGQVYNKHTY